MNEQSLRERCRELDRQYAEGCRMRGENTPVSWTRKVAFTVFGFGPIAGFWGIALWDAWIQPLIG